MAVILVPFALSLITAVALVSLGRLYPGRRGDVHAVQASHTRPTPRLGGVAIAVGLAGALLVLPTAQATALQGLMLSALPVFVAGLLEDSGWRVAPLWRLAASVCSALVAIAVFGILIPRIGFAPLDAVFAGGLPAVLLTALVLSGTAQAFNLVDGLHGLCGFASLITGGALALIASNTGQDALASVLLSVMAAVGGVLVVNFPRGLLFMGDAGAYVLGFILACIAVNMVQRIPDLSAGAVVLVFFWPLADMVFAVVRRTAKRRSPFRADRLHFHHIVLRNVDILLVGKKAGTLSNPISTLILLPLMAAPACLGVLVWNHNGLAFAYVGLSAVLFVLTYRAIVAAAKGQTFLVNRAKPKQP